MQLASVLLAVSIPVMLGAGASAVLGTLVERRMPAMISRLLLLAALGLLVLVLVERAVAAGRAPWANLYETSISFAAMVLLVQVVLERRFAIAALTPIVAVMGAALVGLALAQPSELRPLVPALQAPLLLTVHVGSAIAAYAMAGIAFAAAAGEIVQRAASGRVALLPSAAVTRAVAHRAVLIGFPILTLAILLGAVWANMAWRAYWSNDPKELAAAATWLVYGGYLHAAGRADRWGRLAPWLLVLGFGAVLFTWLGAGLVFVGEHSYAGS